MKAPEVDAWFDVYENPQKDVMLYMRNKILESDARIEECIKWKSPTFMFRGNIASFNPRSKKPASLMFHTGADIPGEFPHLEGTGNVARYLKVTDLANARELETEFISIFASWCESKG